MDFVFGVHGVDEFQSVTWWNIAIYCGFCMFTWHSHVLMDTEKKLSYTQIYTT